MIFLSYFLVVGNVVLFTMLLILKDKYRTDRVYLVMTLILLALMVSGIVLALDYLRIL